MVAHSHWQVYVWTKFLGFGEWQVLLQSALLCPILSMLRNLQDKHKGNLLIQDGSRNSLHGKKIKHQLWSQGKVLFHLHILQSSCAFPKFITSICHHPLTQTHGSHSHLLLHWKKGSGTSWMPHYSNRNSDQQFERWIIATRKQDVIS